MITIDETIQWVTGEFVDIINDEPICPANLRAYEAVMTILSTLEYSKLLTDKFGSLEEALEAEKVVHCRECDLWKPHKTYGEVLGICNKPGSDARYRGAADYCCDGLYYKIADKLIKAEDSE